MRRRRVNDRVVLPIGVLAGAAAALGDASPTGAAATDWLVIVASVGFVTWAGASTPWWAGAALAGLATAIAGDPWWMIVGGAAFAVGLWVGVRRGDLPVVRAVVVGTALNVLIRSELDGFLGLSAIIGISAGAAVAIIGLRRRRTAIRRRAYVVLAATGGFALVALAGFAIAALGARDGLTDGNRLARAGLESLNDGDYVGAAEQFREAAEAFADADDSLGAPWAQPARLVPVVAQNRAAAADVADGAAAASEDLGAVLQVVDPEQLRLVNGRFDLDAIRLVQQPFADVQRSIRELEATIGDVESPWLIAPLATRLTDLDEELAENATKLDNAATAVDLAPALLGGDGPRRYFLAFTTPAETRGLGGFMGNWAEVTADDGRLEITASGRTRDLNQGGDATRAIVGPQDWIDQWGVYGLTDEPGGTTGDVPWSNITVSPQFPSTGAVIASLYPQSGGDELDGVFAMDPYVLQALLGFTGPISVEGSQGQLDERNVLEFLLVDQYEIDDSPTRIDLLEDVSRATLDEVLRGALPNPTVIARELGPLAAEGRLVGWARDQAEQDLFEAVRLSGAMPALDGGDGFAVVLNNAAANKIDVYLGREVVYEATVDETTGVVSATLAVTLRNDVPDTPLPESVTGNYTGDERGTNRALLSLYTALPVTSATIDGERVALRLEEEAGWRVGTTLVGVAAGDAVTITFTLEGPLAVADGYTLATRPQPIVEAEMQSIDVRSSDGEVLVAFEGSAEEPRVFTRPRVD